MTAFIAQMKLNLFPQNNHLRENGFTMAEEESLYERQLRELLENPRWYLDNLDNMREYRLSWVDYRHTKVSIPHRYCRKRDSI